MTVHCAVKDSNSVVYRSGSLILLLFLTGIFGGALFVRYFDLLGSHLSGVSSLADLEAFLQRSFYEIFLSQAKFLLLLYLLAFQRWGAGLILPVYCMEGVFLGGTVCGIVSLMGSGGFLMALLLLLFRLLLVIPYGFLLGEWSIRRSLSFPSAGERTNCIAILLLTLVLLVVSSYLESTLGQWLGSLYYLQSEIHL